MSVTQTINRIKRLKAMGKTNANIAIILNTEKIPTKRGAEWTGSAVDYYMHRSKRLRNGKRRRAQGSRAVKPKQKSTRANTGEMIRDIMTSNLNENTQDSLVDILFNRT